MSEEFAGVTIGSPALANQLNSIASRAEVIARLMPGCATFTYIGVQGYTYNGVKTTSLTPPVALVYAESVVLTDNAQLVVLPQKTLYDRRSSGEFGRNQSELAQQFIMASCKSPAATVSVDFCNNSTAQRWNTTQVEMQAFCQDFDMSSTANWSTPVGCYITERQTGTYGYDQGLCHFIAFVVPMNLLAV